MFIQGGSMITHKERLLAAFSGDAVTTEDAAKAAGVSLGYAQALVTQWAKDKTIRWVDSTPKGPVGPGKRLYKKE